MILFILVVAHVYWPVEPTEEMRVQVSEMLSEHKGAYNASKPVVAVDYTLPVYRKRLWMLDPASGKVLLNCHVGHAWNSGMLWAENFSNLPNTKKSSFGAFVTSESYDGKFGYAMRIRGLDEDVNDNANQRAIVFHGSEIPWSAGCFVTPPAYNKAIIDAARGGALIVVKGGHDHIHDHGRDDPHVPQAAR